jgi:hypothetical protein
MNTIAFEGVSVSEFMKRRGVLAALLAAQLLTGCIWPRFFDIGWDEEVQLHDGRVIVVNVKYKYERQGSWLTLKRYDPAIFREATMTFDAGPPTGVITQHFIHQRPMLLDTFAGQWFVVLQGRAGQAVQRWGMDQNGNGQRTALLVGKAFEPVEINKLPVWMKSANLLMDYAPKEDLAAFSGTRLTLAQKAVYVQKYPLGPIDTLIGRPEADLAKR